MKPTILLRLVAVFLVVTVLPAAKKLSYRDSDAEGAWFGVSEGGMYSSRLVLGRGGTGLLALRYLDREAAVYRVQTWHVVGHKVELKLVAVRPWPYEFSISIEFRGLMALNMKVTDTGRRRPKWSFNAFLWSEEKLARAREGLVRAMGETEKGLWNGPP